MNELITIGQLAQRSGVAPSALRFYEERGLLGSQRTRAGHRRYHRSTLRRVAFIVFAQRIGLSLDEVRGELGRLPDGQVPVQRDWAKLSATWKKRIDERIAELERLRESLTHCIGCGCLSLGKCKLYNPKDKQAARGPGPVLWNGATRPLPRTD